MRSDGSTGVLADAVFATGARLADEQQKALAANGNAVIIGAVAAAGIAAMPLAAATTHVVFSDPAEATLSSGPSSPAGGEAEYLRPALNTETREPVGNETSPTELGQSGQGQSLPADSAAAGATPTAPAQLSEGTDLAPVPGSEAPFVAASVMIPPAELLLAKAGANASRSSTMLIALTKCLE